MYNITQYTFDRAKELGVVVKPSTLKGKKIDVYEDNKKIASIGAIDYKDYPTYLKEKGKEYAEERQRLYHIRHKENTLNEKLALYLLW